ncbi:alpha/beta fold hydrolase [soil metagenome]
MQTPAVEMNGDAAASWVLRVPDSSPNRLRLLCLPHAGSGASWYSSWANRLGSDVDVVPLQPPGRESRIGESAFSCMNELVDALYAAVLPLCRHPYSVFGHSMGSHVAFELVRRLRDAAMDLPVCLIVSGARAPHLAAARPCLFELGDDALLAAIESRYGACFEPEIRELVRLTMPTLRADLQLVETQVHRAGTPLPVPMLVLAGASDASVPLADARQWERHTSETFEFKLFPGGHFFPMTQREAVLGCIARRIANHGVPVR